MTQILGSVNKLTQEQIETCIKNLAAIRHFKQIEKIFEGKPSYDKTSMDKMAKLNLSLDKVTKFADNYIIYRFSKVEKSSPIIDLLKECNENIKIKNLDERVEFIIVVDSNKIDKQNYFALLALYPLIHDQIKNDGRSYVTICPSNHIEPAMRKHFNFNFIPCKYQLFSLYDVAYPLIGSKTTLWCGFVYDYQVIEYEKLYNGKNYSIITNNDPVVKLLNADDNDLIIAIQVLTETWRPYSEFIIKQVKPTNDELEEIEED